MSRVRTPSSGRTMRSRSGRHAEQRPPAGRRHEPVEDRLDLIGGGVAGGHQVEPRPRRARPRPPRSAPSRACASRFPRPVDAARARRAAAPRGRSHSSPQNRSSSRGAGRSPWFTCRASTRSGPSTARERMQRDTPSRRRRRAARGRAPAAPGRRCPQGRGHPLDRVAGHISYLTPVGTRVTRAARRLVHQCPASPSPAAGLAVRSPRSCRRALLLALLTLAAVGVERSAAAGRPGRGGSRAS